MATGKGQSHDLGTPVSRQVSHVVGEGRIGRDALSRRSNGRTNQNRQEPSTPVKIILPYSMVIQWSDVDEVYMVTLPEFDHAKTHGKTYAAAAKQGQLLIESFLMWYQQDGKPLPTPQKFVFENEELLAPT